MWPSLLLFVQAAQLAAPSQSAPSPYQVLAAEHTRGADVRVLERALTSGDTVLQRHAVRALGRFEQPEHAALVQPMLLSPAVSVRREAANALAQMKRVDALPPRFGAEQDASARGALYESWGRVIAASPAAEQQLAASLNETALPALRGAARGMESYLRRTARAARPTAATTAALRATFARVTDHEVRHVVLLAMTAAGDRDTATIATALRDSSAQVRRTAVAFSRAWHDDSAPMVRWQALRVAGTCERAAAHVRDSSEHVALLAIDLLGELKCDPTMLRSMTGGDVAWRPRAHATLALARVAPVEASSAVRTLAASPVWQARAWAAQAAKLLKDSTTLAQLVGDAAPNVVIAAMSTPAQAVRALSADHAGLLLEAATQLKGSAGLSAARPALMRTFDRITAAHGVTWRDPRVALLARITETATAQDVPWLRRRLADRDPVIAAAAAASLTTLTGATVAPTTTRYVPPSFPSASTLASLEGATAQIRIQGKGVIEVDFLTNEAPMAVHAFVTQAEAGAYTGKTMHRIVPNFVIQGGSPGADEYDPSTSYFMRDEVGFARNDRGTFGISTRGRDTGDGQLYVNLIDNVRLDHDYTVFAITRRGLSVVDAVQEGDVIESVTIRRAAAK